MSPSSFRSRVFRPLVTKANIPYYNFHAFRHTVTTLLRSAGTHPKIVSEMLGHSSVSITLDIYSHAVPTLHRDAADRWTDSWGANDRLGELVTWCGAVMI